MESNGMELVQRVPHLVVEPQSLRRAIIRQSITHFARPAMLLPPRATWCVRPGGRWGVAVLKVQYVEKKSLLMTKLLQHK